MESQSKTAFQLWEILNKSFTRSLEHRKIILKNKINSLKYTTDEDIHIFLAALQNLFEELERIDTDISDSNKVGILNRTLPENLRWVNVFQFNNDWKACCDYVKRIIPDIIFSNLKETNQLEENPRNVLNLQINKERNQNIKSKAIKKRRKNGKCYICGKYGHFQKECWNNKRNKNNKNYNKINKRRSRINSKFNKNNYQKKHAYLVNKNENYQDDFIKDYNSENGIDIDYAVTNNPNDSNLNQINNIQQSRINQQDNKVDNNITVWVLDSGASISITNSILSLINIRKCEISISLANGKEIISNYIGDFVGFVNNDKFILKNVYYSKLIKRNLISINQLISQNYKIVFNNYKNKPYAVIYNQYGNRIYQSISDNKNTFKIFISKYPIQYNNHNENLPNNKNEINYSHLKDKNSLDLWHRRLGHYNISSIKNRLTTIKTKTQCHICANSKMKKKSFKPSNKRSNKMFDLIHMDLVGPIAPSVNGNKYFLTILDDFSRFGWVLFLQSKNDTFNHFINWYNKTFNFFNISIKAIRTDNGKEFLNNNFKIFCQQNGIYQQHTIPYNPSQNGRAERFNGILISSAKALLNEAKLSHTFWEFAIDTANFIHNRLPHQGINNQIPFEILYNKPVDYSIFRVFGCRVFFFIPKELRSKFDNNSHPGIFLGYSNNPSAYKILDLISNKIILSKSVEFMENDPGNSSLLNINPHNEFRENELDKYIRHSQHESNYDSNRITKSSMNNKNTKFRNKNNNNNKIGITHNSTSTDNINNSNTSINNNNNYHTHNNDHDNNIPNNNDHNNTTNSDNLIENTDNTSTNKRINNNTNNEELNDNTYKNNIMDNHNTLESTEIQNETKFDNNENINNNKRKIKETQYNINKKKKTKFLSSKLSTNNTEEFVEPYNYKDIFKMNDKEEWLKAVNEELINMKKLNVFTKVKRVPSGSNIISSRWVFKYKKNDEGKIIKRKARLVAKGYTQQLGIDYKETFAPTLKQDSLRIITALAVQNNFNIEQIDVNSAYLNAPLTEEIYMRAPEGHSSYNKYYWKLNKALYGLKQAGKEWNRKLNHELTIMGFKRAKSEPCVYIKSNNHGKITCILSVYVDDILIAGNNKDIDKVKRSIKRKFNIKDIGNVEFVIGIKFMKTANGYILHQIRYVNEILNKYNINELTPVRNLIPIENLKLRCKNFDETKYRSAIGSLLYLGICTRPDILFAVSRAARKSTNPTLEDWDNVLRIFRYIKYTKHYGIKIEKNISLKVYVDADYAGDSGTRKSTSGFLMMMGNTPTSWYSKLQHCVSTSTAEAEYYSLSECAKHSLWYKNFLNELNIKISSITIFVDNKATIYNSKNQSINPKSKHIDIRYHHIRDLVNKQIIRLKYIKSKDNLADGFTKYLNSNSMDKFRNSILSKI